MKLQKELLSVQLASISDESPYSDRKKALFFIHDFNFNLNGFRITEDLCTAINSKTNKPNYDSLNGSPLVCASDGFDLKGHEPEFDDNGNIVRLNTQSCGTLFDTHVGTHEINGVEKYGVWASGYLWLRFENTMSVIENIFNQCGSVDTSVEVLTGGYEMSEEGRTAKNSLIYTGHCLLGTKVSPAYPDSGMYEFNMEVAEAYQKDLSLDNSQVDNINSPDGGGNVFKFKLEMNADGSTLSFAEMRKQMNLHLNKIGKHMSLQRQMMDLNAMDVEAYGAMANAMLAMMSEDAKYFDLWCPEDGMFEGYCVCSDWYNGAMFMMDWANNNDEIEMSNPRKAKIQYVEANELVVNSIVKELGEVNQKVEELSSQLETKTKELEDKVNEFNSLVDEKTKLEEKVNELSEVKTEEEIKNEAIVKLNEQINSLNEKITQMQPMVDEYLNEQEVKRQQEIAEKQENLKQFAINSKVIDTKEFDENEALKNAITELNEQFVKSLIADRIVANATKQETKVDNDVTITVNSNGQDLIPQDSKSYMYAPKKRD